jgi:malonyl-CoA O-methyltransferase
VDAPRTDLDGIQARRAFERAAATCTGVAAVSREIEERMAEKLDYLKVAPGSILDAGAGAGASPLRRRFPRTQLIAVDLSAGMLRASSSERSLVDRVRDLATGRGTRSICADFSQLPLRAATVGMVWSNLALAWAQDPLRALREFHRVLAPGGALMFSTYGPDTLSELRNAFTAADDYQHVHAFVDMHDLGDMLVAAGFDAPVMEMERLEVTYSDVEALARELKLSGQTCASRVRRRSLMTPRAWRRMRDAYEKLRARGRLPATVEVVYGHAWRGEPRVSSDGRRIVKLERPHGGVR